MCKSAYGLVFIGGSLIDCFNAETPPLDPSLVLRIFYQMARGVAYLHAQTPPITHRDIKVGIQPTHHWCSKLYLHDRFRLRTSLLATIIR